MKDFSNNDVIVPLTGREMKTETGAFAAIIEGRGRVDVKDFKGQSKGRRVADDAFTLEVGGAPLIGTKADPTACETLANTMRQQGTQVQATKGRDGYGEDGILEFEGGPKLTVQITTVPQDHAHCEKVKTGQEASLEFNTAEGAEMIRDAIRHKESILAPLRSKIVLGLDARHAGILTDAAIVAAVRAQYPELGTLGFAGIWLIGPAPGSTVQLA